MKKFLLSIFNWPLLRGDRVNFYQEKIRDAEWKAVMRFIPRKSKLLDVGCGRGYSMMRASNELQCDVRGIDPQAIRYINELDSFSSKVPQLIDDGTAEQLPYDDESFDVVFSSHVLEHAADQRKAMLEMKRVARKNGTILIGVPTATMAVIGLISHVLFTTHIRWYNFFSHKGKLQRDQIKFLFLPGSHSHETKTVLYDIKNYHVKKWEMLIGSEFKIQKILFTALYPYPDFRQLFSLRNSRKSGSSVFFVCSK